MNRGKEGKTLPVQFRRMKKKDPVGGVEERLGHIEKALSVLPQAEADALFLDIVSKPPRDILAISQPYISHSYSLKLLDSRQISDPQHVPSLRVPFALSQISSQNSHQKSHLANRPSLSPLPLPHDDQSAETRFKAYVDNFCHLNERMYEINKANSVKPQKLKQRLPVRISQKTIDRIKASERRTLLAQAQSAAHRVNLDLHKVWDQDLYLPDPSALKGQEKKMAQLASEPAPQEVVPQDDYMYDKNYNYYVQLNTNINRGFKIARDPSKTGVFLGRTPAAGQELDKIQKALKPFYTALPQSNLNIVKEFYRVYKHIGSKLNHKNRGSRDTKTAGIDLGIGGIDTLTSSTNK
jgi:hypothetical protein